MKQKALTVKLSGEDYRWLKVYCAENDRTVQRVMATAFQLIKDFERLELERIIDEYKYT